MTRMTTAGDETTAASFKSESGGCYLSIWKLGEQQYLRVSMSIEGFASFVIDHRSATDEELCANYADFIPLDAECVPALRRMGLIEYERTLKENGN